MENSLRDDIFTSSLFIISLSDFKFVAGFVGRVVVFTMRRLSATAASACLRFVFSILTTSTSAPLTFWASGPASAKNMATSTAFSRLSCAR